MFFSGLTIEQYLRVGVRPLQAKARPRAGGKPAATIVAPSEVRRDSTEFIRAPDQTSRLTFVVPRCRS